MSPRQGTSWLKYGCFGCLAVVGLLVVVAGSLVGIAALMARSENVVSRELRQDLPAAPSAATGEIVEALAAGTPVRVLLDLQHAEFEIDRGDELRVDARYVEGAYELIEKLDRLPEGEIVYRVEFRRTGSGLLTGLREFLGGTQAKLRVELPADARIDLEVRLGRGALQCDLGGLWLGSALIAVSQGGAQVDFGEPLRAPMERLEVDLSMGGLELAGVGHASPAEFTLNVSMGGANVDLRGPWSRDARIAIDTRMAATVVQLPDDVRIVGLDRGGPQVRPEREVELPTLTFEVSEDDRGELQFVD
jgi:hypothetical protein